MDRDRFDRWTRRVAVALDRRAVVTGVVVAAVACLPAVGPPTAVAARKCLKDGVRCGVKSSASRRCADCCSGTWNRGARKKRCGTPAMTCTGYQGACAVKKDCCKQMLCTGNQCVVDCPATLTAAGCALNGLGSWQCTGRNLTGVNLSGCDLTTADFTIANVTNAVFAQTILINANFLNATVTGAVWDDTTCPTSVNSDANGGTCCGQFVVDPLPTGC